MLEQLYIRWSRLTLLAALLITGAVVVGLPTSLCADSTSEPETTQGTECAPLPGLETALERSSLLVFGEIHGTVQSPAMVGLAICHIAASGRPVSLALELPRDEQPLLDAVLASDSPESMAAARDALLASPFWSHDQPDGRSSQAMWRLLEGMRQLVQQGKTVQVVAFDIPFGAPREQREEDMASFLADALSAAPDNVQVVLTGNLHSRTLPGTYLPLAGYLKRQFPHLLSFDVSHEGGTAWVCLLGVQGCQLQKVGPRQPRPERGIHLLEEADRFGHLGAYSVGPLTGSEPAAGG